MKRHTQTLGEILGALGALEVDWQDETALRVVERIQALPSKTSYDREDVAGVVDGGPFEDGMLIVRLFLGLSKDRFQGALANALKTGGAGAKRWKAEREIFLDALVELGAVEAMTVEVNKPLHWSDTLVERLRSGRGSAISGQTRGRGVEDSVEAAVKAVFGNHFVPRVTFSGRPGRTAKCDFAIPNKEDPRIIIEAKGYGATGSKMTDIIGDIQAIIDAKRGDTSFLFVTDGLTWQQRQSDLKKIVAFQNTGDIVRIYTFAMLQDLEDDLRTLKQENGI